MLEHGFIRLGFTDIYTSVYSKSIHCEGIGLWRLLDLAVLLSMRTYTREQRDCVGGGKFLKWEVKFIGRRYLHANHLRYEKFIIMHSMGLRSRYLLGIKYWKP